MTVGPLSQFASGEVTMLGAATGSSELGVSVGSGAGGSVVTVGGSDGSVGAKVGSGVSVAVGSLVGVEVAA